MKMYQMTEMEMSRYGTQVAHLLIQNLVAEKVIDESTGDRLECTKIVVYREASTFGRFWRHLFKGIKATDGFPLVATIQDRRPDSEEAEEKAVEAQ